MLSDNPGQKRCRVNAESCHASRLPQIGSTAFWGFSERPEVDPQTHDRGQASLFCVKSIAHATTQVRDGPEDILPFAVNRGDWYEVCGLLCKASPRRDNMCVRSRAAGTENRPVRAGTGPRAQEHNIVRDRPGYLTTPAAAMFDCDLEVSHKVIRRQSQRKKLLFKTRGLSGGICWQNPQGLEHLQ
ncbi:hypothetical protein Bbelb_093980 [Branchiostoma belcheri]|nr:hypothetical protein Bbelb_093980 [Branchiostoma belcheri]